MDARRLDLRIPIEQADNVVPHRKVGVLLRRSDASDVGRGNGWYLDWDFNGFGGAPAS